MSEFSTGATFSYTDYRNFDFLVSGGTFFGEDTAGFTMYATLSGIPQTSPLTGEPTICALTISFGDANLGVRIGRRVTFGFNGEFPIDADGVLVAAITVGYLGNNNFALAGGTVINIPSGLGGSTLAGYFHKGNLPEDTYIGNLTLFAMQSVPLTGGGGQNPLTDRAKNLEVTEVTDLGSNIARVKFEFDYFNNNLENPLNLTLKGETEDGFAILVDAPLWVNGVTHYTGTSDLNLAGLTIGRSYWVIAIGSASQTSPGSNVISIIANPTMQDMLDLVRISLSVQEQVNNPAVVASASGIYTITPGKTDDTLYLIEPFNNVTEDVKIPDPFAKLGLIP